MSALANKLTGLQCGICFKQVRGVFQRRLRRVFSVSLPKILGKTLVRQIGGVANCARRLGPQETRGSHTDVMDKRLQFWSFASFFPLLLAGPLLGSGAWAAGPTVMFKIPAGEFSQTVIEFYKQAHVEILYASIGSVKGVKTHAVEGNLEASVALAKMLEGTGIAFEFENDQSVLLRRDTAGTAVGENKEGSATVLKGPSEGERSPREASGSSEVAPQMQEVVVTGSYLHGVLDIMSPLLSVTRTKMAQSSYATVQDALLNLPLNSLSVQSESFGGNGNYNLGTAPNLRGLGYGATLVLVDGHRQPAGGTDGDFVDISNIPWSMVDRIEVLPDGASALYGSDAIAGVVNIITRKNLQGAETQFRTGTAPDGAGETFAAQLFGGQWKTGRWLLGYQYSNRTPLSALDREYTANADKRSFGGSDFRNFRSNPGNIFSPSGAGPAFAIPRGQDGTSLSIADLSSNALNLQNQFVTFDLAPQRQMHNISFNASQKIGDHIELFSEGNYTRREVRYSGFSYNQMLVVPKTNAYFVDPFGGSPYVVVAYDFLDDLGGVTSVGQTQSYIGTLGARAALGNDWQATLSGSYGGESLRAVLDNIPDQSALAAALASSNPDTAFNPFGDGSNTNPEVLAAIRSTQKVRAASTITSTSLVSDGSVLNLPSGVVKLAVGAEFRHEGLDRGTTLLQDFDRKIVSTFAELAAPLIGNLDNPRAVPRLELSLAGRYENYSDFGHTFNPKIGLRWIPLKWMKLRTSWSTSFKAPKLADLYDTSNNLSGLGLIPDPRSPTGLSLFLGIQGSSNLELKQETASTWTAGIDLAPEMTPGLTLSMTYFNIDYDNQIIQPAATAPFQILYQEDQWASVITRNPSQEQIAAICNRPDFMGSVSDCLKSSPAAIIDIRLRNLASTRVKGLDVKLQHSLDTSYGNFSFDLDGTYMFSFKQALTKTSPEVDVLNTVGNPLALKLRSTLGWAQHGKDQPGFGANVAASYTGSYRNPQSTLRPRVDAYLPIDLQLNYRTSSGTALFNNVQLLLNAANIFDETPPFVDINFGFDRFNAMPYGRVVSLFIGKTW